MGAPRSRQSTIAADRKLHRRRQMVRMRKRGPGVRTIGNAVVLAFGITGFVVAFANADDNFRSSPPDTESYSRPLVAEDLALGKTAGVAGLAGGVSFSVVDTVVNNTNPNLRFTDTFGDQETSIAV